MHQRKGALVIIGGHEDRTREKTILREVARMVGKGKLVVTTVASHEPDGLFRQYKEAFTALGVKEVVELEIRTREEAISSDMARIVEGAKGVFFTGGDQLKIASQLGGTGAFEAIKDVFASGGVVAGTSAGASVMCETMLVSGGDDESYKRGDTVGMAPGLGLARGLIIDQHFAERGRMGRLLGTVAHNPEQLGLGIDENTAVVMRQEDAFEIIGDGAVYVLDCAKSPYSNIGEEDETSEILAIFDARVHVLNAGKGFDMKSRTPRRSPSEKRRS